MSNVVQRATATRDHPFVNSSPFLVTLTLTNVQAGNTILIIGGSVSYPASSITDTAGNSYTVDNIQTGLYYGAVAHCVANGTGDVTITVSFSDSTACAIMAVELTNVAGLLIQAANGNSVSIPQSNFQIGVSTGTPPVYIAAAVVGQGQSFTSVPSGTGSDATSRARQEEGASGSYEFGGIADIEAGDGNNRNFEWHFTANTGYTYVYAVIGLAATGQASPTKDNVRSTPYFAPPDPNYSYYRRGNLAFPVTYLPDALFRGPKNQTIIRLPDFDDRVWQQRTKSPELTNLQPVRDNPPGIAKSQRVEPNPEYDHSWYQVRRLWPTPVEYFPTAPPTRQPDQRWWDVPVWEDITPYIPRNKVPGPSLYLSTILGRYNIYGEFVKETHRGVYRIANSSVKGYAVWIGVDELPDFRQDPDAFSLTLPVTIPIPIPLVQTTYYVVVRKRDKYGLVSQNQRPTLITVGADGIWVLPPIPTPVDLKALISTGAVNLRANYPTVSADPYPADHWKIWLNTTAPDTDNDLPTLIGVVGGSTVLVQLRNYGQSNALTPVVAGNTYYYAVALVRSADGMVSEALTGSIDYPAPLGVPGDVHGPFTVGY